jgi:hypothetical protein
MVAMIYRRLLPVGAVIRQRGEGVQGMSADQDREADIELVTVVAGQSITLAIECREFDQPATPEWIDELIGKHAGRAVKVVAISSAGFTAAASERAREASIDTIGITEASDRQWRDWVSGINTYWISLEGWIVHGITNIELVNKHVALSLEPTAMEAYDTIQFQVEGILGRQDAANLLEWARHRANPTVDAKHQLLPRSDGLMTFEVWLPKWSVVILPGGRRLGVERVDFAIEVQEDIIAVPLTPGEFGVTSFAAGRGLGRQFKAEIVAVQDGKGEAVLDLCLSDAAGHNLPAATFTLYGDRK